METRVGEKVKRILTIAFPLIMQGIVFQLQSLTDKAFLGNLDTKYVSAMGSAQMPYNAVGDSIVAISIGITILISRLHGAKKQNEMKSIIQSSILFSSILGALIFIFWQVGCSDVLTFFSVSSDIMNDSVKYIKICSVYMLFIGIDSTLHAYLQGIGNTRPIMIAGIIKVAFNILISWMLIFGNLGFPALYVTGAAIGTLLANILASIYIIIYCLFCHNKKYQILQKGSCWFDVSKYMRVLKLGIPSGIEYFLWNFSNLILIRFINEFGYQSMAIYSITFGCQCMVYVTFSAIAKASLTIMGQHLGAGEKEASNKCFWTCLIINFLIVGIAAIIFILFPKQLLNAFSNDKMVIQNGIQYLIFLGIIMFPQSLNVICGNGIKAKGDTRWMLISQIIGSIVVLSVSWILIRACGMDMMAIYITLFVDESVRGIINFIHYRRMDLAKSPPRGGVDF